MPQQIQQRAGIEISGAGRARDSTQRSERHGGVAAAAVLDGADAAATPQMREDGAALQDSSVVAGDYAERGGEGESMETVAADARSEEHTSELQSLMRISYAVFCLKTKKTTQCIPNFQHNNYTRY